MNTNLKPRSLLSLDWIAFGIGLAAVSLQWVWHQLGGLAAVAIFTPAILRELGWVKDGDELTLAAMRRAGLHGLLVAIGLVILSWLMSLGGVDVMKHSLGPAVFTGAELHKVVAGAYLVSYVIQTWGARLGVSRVLIAAGVLSLGPIVGFLRSDDPAVRTSAALVLAALALVFFLLAWLVRSRPRIGAAVLSLLFAAAVVAAVFQFQDSRLFIAGVSLIVQAGILFGATGWVLWREQRLEKEGAV